MQAIAKMMGSRNTQIDEPETHLEMRAGSTGGTTINIIIGMLMADRIKVIIGRMTKRRAYHKRRSQIV